VTKFLLIFIFLGVPNCIWAGTPGLFPKVLSSISSRAIFVSQAIARQTLPFPYCEVPRQDVKKSTFVFEKYYTVLTDDAKLLGNKFAIVGPLNPCVFVGIRNEENGKCIIFHKWAYSSLDSLVAITKKELELGENDGAKIRAHLFTNECRGYNSMISNGRTWRERHAGKSQEEEMKFIKDTLISAFCVPNERLIKAKIFKNRWNVFASLSILTNSKLELNSICLAREGIFAESFTLGGLEIFSIDEALRGLHWSRFMSDMQSFDEVTNSYNSVPFARAPDSEKELE
jgi:hypothetical protein